MLRKSGGSAQAELNVVKKTMPRRMVKPGLELAHHRHEADHLGDRTER
jgi:hypothetical protein